MKNVYIVLLCLSLLSTTSYIHTSDDQDVDASLNILQQSITTLVTESDIDPEVAQDIINQTDELNQNIQLNIQQDIKEIRVAAAMTSLIETVNKITQNIDSMTDVHNLLSDLKYATRANTIHKLLMGAYPGQFKDQTYYTNPYIESIGFIINDFVFTAIFQALLNAIAPTQFGSSLLANSTPQINDFITQIAAGITAHCAWLLQKKLAFQQTHNNTQS